MIGLRRTCVRTVKSMQKLVLAAALLLFAGNAPADEATYVRPFESEHMAATTPLDEHVLAGLAARGIEPAHTCSDEVYLRRVFLDVIGTLPEPEECRAFQVDPRPDKRARLVDDLLVRDEYADYWSLKWCDVLRVKAEFPINLWPNAVQAYHRWVRESVRDNRPYDEFARALLTSSGSNFRVPPVNFHRAVPGREPGDVGAAAALTFMGERVERWPADRRDGLSAFFSRTAFKRTAEWKEEIVFLDPAPAGPLEAVFPDGERVTVPPRVDPREAFADWLIQPDNPWFARNAVNRIWYWLLGRGIVHEPDDVRPDNPPSNPELLAYLADELVKSGYDLRHVQRLILTSRTYQQSSIPRSDRPDAAALFAYYPVRRLDAEVLVDALCRIGGAGERYTSRIPEPFTFVPEEHRSIGLADGSITSQFLEMFGRPARDSGRASERSNRTTAAQRLHLLNSTEVQQRIQRSPRLGRIFRRYRQRPGELVRRTWLTILSRLPTPQERSVATAYLKAPGASARDKALDLAWALINTREFLFRH